MAGRLAGDENPSRVLTSIEGLMCLSRRYFETLTSVEDKTVLLYFEGKLSLKNVEKLP